MLMMMLLMYEMGWFKSLEAGGVAQEWNINSWTLLSQYHGIIRYQGDYFSPWSSGKVKKQQTTHNPWQFKAAMLQM